MKFVPDEKPQEQLHFVPDDTSPPKAQAAPGKDVDADPGPVNWGEYGKEPLGALVAEPLMEMGSSMFAAPAGNVVGLARTGIDAISDLWKYGTGPIPAKPPGQTPEDLKKDVQDFLTYRPRTELGKLGSEMNPVAVLGRWLSGKAKEAGEFVAPPETSGPLRKAAGQFVEEGIKQAPPFLAPVIGKGMELGGKVMDTGAHSMMMKALKPTIAAKTKILPVTGKTRAESAIDEMFSKPSQYATRGMIEKFEQSTKAMEKEMQAIADKSGGSFPAKAAADFVNNSRQKFANVIGNTTDLATIEKVYNDFIKQFPGDLTIKQALQIKQATYKAIGDKAYGGQVSPAEISATKDIIRGLKSKIEEYEPKAKPLTEAQSRQMNAMKVLERRLMTSANKHLLGLGVFALHNPIGFATWMAQRSELFQSMIAQMLHHGGKALKSYGRPLVEQGVGAAADPREGLVPAAIGAGLLGTSAAAQQPQKPEPELGE